MFGKNNPAPAEEKTYIVIQSRLAKLRVDAVLKQSIPPQWHTEFKKKLNRTPLNRSVAENKHLDHINDLKTNSLLSTCDRLFAVLVSRAVCNEEELNKFVEGLTVDAWAYTKDTEKVREAYRKYPQLIILRLIELYM